MLSPSTWPAFPATANSGFLLKLQEGSCRHVLLLLLKSVTLGSESAAHLWARWWYGWRPVSGTRNGRPGSQDCTTGRCSHLSKSIAYCSWYHNRPLWTHSSYSCCATQHTSTHIPQHHQRAKGRNPLQCWQPQLYPQRSTWQQTRLELSIKSKFNLQFCSVPMWEGTNNKIRGLQQLIHVTCFWKGLRWLS